MPSAPTILHHYYSNDFKCNHSILFVGVKWYQRIKQQFGILAPFFGGLALSILHPNI